jgi:hypothetical protein
MRVTRACVQKALCRNSCGGESAGEAGKARGRGRRLDPAPGRLLRSVEPRQSLPSPQQVKGIVSRDEYFIECLKNRNDTF